MFGGLNNDFVLLTSLGAVAISFVVLIAWGIKAFRSIEGMDKESQ